MKFGAARSYRRLPLVRSFPWKLKIRLLGPHASPIPRRRIRRCGAGSRRRRYSLGTGHRNRAARPRHRLPREPGAYAQLVESVSSDTAKAAGRIHGAQVRKVGRDDQTKVGESGNQRLFVFFEKSARVGVVDWIVEDVAVPIESLAEKRRLQDRIGRREPGGKRVVDP